MNFFPIYKDIRAAILTFALICFLSVPASTQHTTGDAGAFRWRVESSYGHRSDGNPGRSLWLLLKDTTYKGTVTIRINCKGITETTSFQNGKPSGRFQIYLPGHIGVDSAATAEVTVDWNSQSASATIDIPRRKHWTVYIYPHSHLDIGYTALPEDVKKLQVRNIDVGIDIARKTQNYPEGARFVWNPEATWVVQSYLDVATADQKKKFIEAVKKGWIQVDGGHSNANLTTCSDEELIHFFRNAASIQQSTGLPINTMVQMDLPGVPWGLVTVAAKFGIKNFVSFPNLFDLRKQWEHKPFYWLGPDGKTKMFFLQGFPYGIGYTIKGSKYGLGKVQRFTNEYDRVSTDEPLRNFINPFILNETAKLDDAGSPYDIFAMTWSMADNCVIDADLPEAVRAWNERYAFPKLVIAGSKDIVDAYEKKYAGIIPTYSGEFTEFWTNGLGSDAASVGAGRIAKEQLVQGEILSTIIGSQKNNSSINADAWEDQLLSAEHTWGAQNSESELATQVEKIKSGYFLNSKTKSEDVIAQSIAEFGQDATGFSVVNTLSWDRTGIVTLRKEQSTAGDGIVDEMNRPVLSQRLSTGELIFKAEKIPALGSKWYRNVSGPASIGDGPVVTTTGMANSLLSLAIDTRTGNISSVKGITNNYEYVDATVGLNNYQHLPSVYNGRTEPGSPTTTSNTTIRIEEKGPLMVSLVSTSAGAGVTKLNREIRLYDGLPVVEVINTFDKISTRKKEGIHFGFGFNIPSSTGRMDMPWSIVSPNTDQLEGSNKNWFSFQRWVDISNDTHGITWSAIESPLLEWGALSGNILDGARLASIWQKEVPSSSVIYSWPLNNHWETNFPLEQGGLMTQRYAFTIHDGYNVVAANRFGSEQNRPLLVVPSSRNVIRKALVKVSNPRLVISTMKKTEDGKATLLRIRSISDKPETLKMDWPAGKPLQVTECEVDGTGGVRFRRKTTVPPYGMVNLRIVFKDKY